MGKEQFFNDLGVPLLLPLVFYAETADLVKARKEED